MELCFGTREVSPQVALVLHSRVRVLIGREALLTRSHDFVSDPIVHNELRHLFRISTSQYSLLGESEHY